MRSSLLLLAALPFQLHNLFARILTLRGFLLHVLAFLLGAVVGVDGPGLSASVQGAEGGACEDGGLDEGECLFGHVGDDVGEVVLVVGEKLLVVGGD